jgi:hypothetical protein
MDPNPYMRLVHRQRFTMRHQGQNSFLCHPMRAWTADGRFHPRHRPLVDVLLQIE